ncbi:hypothetical protein CORC01_07681 [Colletotrichum orchidophilum]|uniref:Uncharacterized protein n=1 Tax=Colletotrichum orchidophilum TaxID=1209926 RepID=A0A1G4B709_9PEZI|nr:uncharacterized protein CORC01_07681 [Colletotrichum orchidophilum]OHE97072.1 hypothetical protein CORC01_07681 [Colletotrichum orchidophilum]
MQLWSHKAAQDARIQSGEQHHHPSLREMLDNKNEPKAGGIAPENISGPIPIILCGQSEQIGRGVIEGLKPDYEVIHFITSAASGAVIIPALLTSKTTPPPQHPDTSTIGSGNYAAPPRAVVLGSVFDDAAVELLQKAVVDDDQGTPSRKVPWLRHDLRKPAPPLGPEYGKAMVARVKEVLGRLEGEGKLGGEYGGDEWY